MGPVLAAGTLWAGSVTLLTAALPFRFEEAGLSIVQYGVTLAVYALGMLLTETLWGVLAFRLARPGRILVLGGVAGLATLLLGASSTFPLFLAAAGLVGAFGVFLVPLMRWVTLTAGGPGTGGRGTGALALFFGVGFVVGSAVGPWLFVERGYWTVALVSALMWAGSVVLLALVPWTAARLPVRAAGASGGVRSVATGAFATVAVLVALEFVALTLTSNFLQYYSVDLFRGTASEAGFVLGAARATTLSAGFLLGRVVDRFGPARSAPFGFLLLGAGALGLLVAPDYAWMVAVTLVFAAGTGWLSSTLLPLALLDVPPSAQGTAIGLVGSLEDLGMLLGPVLLGASWALLGPASIFGVTAGVALLGAGFAAVSGRLDARGPARRAPSGP